MRMWKMSWWSELVYGVGIIAAAGAVAFVGAGAEYLFRGLHEALSLVPH